MEKKESRKKSANEEIEIRESASALLNLLKKTVTHQKTYTNGDVSALTKKLHNSAVANLALTAIYGK